MDRPGRLITADIPHGLTTPRTTVMGGPVIRLDTVSHNSRKATAKSTITAIADDAV